MTDTAPESQKIEKTFYKESEEARIKWATKMADEMHFENDDLRRNHIPGLGIVPWSASAEWSYKKLREDIQTLRLSARQYFKEKQLSERKLEIAINRLQKISDSEGHGMKRTCWNDIARHALIDIEAVE